MPDNNSKDDQRRDNCENMQYEKHDDFKNDVVFDLPDREVPEESILMLATMHIKETKSF